MKPIEEPVRWLDPRSDATDDVRAMLSRARDALGPSKAEMTRLGAFAASAGMGAALGGAAGAGKVAAVRAGSHLVTKVAWLKLGAALAVAGAGAGVGYSVLHTTREAPAMTTTVVASSAGPAAASVQAEDLAHAEPPASSEVPEAPPAPVVQAASVPGVRQRSVPVVSTASPPPATAPSLAPPPLVPTTAAMPTTPAAPAAVGVAENPAPAPAPTGESELTLLDRARARVGSNPAAALRALDEHRARFPRGTFVQEREVLAIEALVHLGRRQEAKARADAFARAFPASAHRRRIAVLLGEAAGD